MCGSVTHHNAHYVNVSEPKSRCSVGLECLTFLFSMVGGADIQLRA